MAPRCVRRSAVGCPSTARAESKACSPVDQRPLRPDQTLEGHAANRGGHGRVTDRQCQPRSDRCSREGPSSQRRGVQAMTSWGVMAPRCVRWSAVGCPSTARAESKACSPSCRRLLRSDQTLEAHSTNRGGHGRATDRHCPPIPANTYPPIPNPVGSSVEWRRIAGVIGASYIRPRRALRSTPVGSSQWSVRPGRSETHAGLRYKPTTGAGMWLLSVSPVPAPRARAQHRTWLPGRSAH